uniref:Bm702 n=1 Tax=Brugia malayi TaxID=6279 RepID=A0A1I9G525_BRUMA|nr:Bm702 [Brugia malayi]
MVGTIVTSELDSKLESIAVKVNEELEDIVLNVDNVPEEATVDVSSEIIDVIVVSKTFGQLGTFVQVPICSVSVASAIKLVSEVFSEYDRAVLSVELEDVEVLFLVKMVDDDSGNISVN